ncbi:MAG: transglutaminase-like domain-containing protein [Planctomycetaceae bacterium]|nr:transglutaminase-like domain-containing protein [Planctomycetaceae bacterium]
MVFCVCGAFFIFGYPRVVDVLISRVTVPVADLVVEGNLLRDGGEYWEAISDGKKQIGFQKTIIRNQPNASYFERQSRLMLLRHGELFDVAMKLISESDADGSFVSGQSLTRVGADPIETNFQVRDDKLIISTDKTENSIEWDKNVAGADAVLRSLLQKPMQPNEKRTIVHLDPSQSQIIETILIAGDIRELRQYSGKLLEIFVQNNIVGETVTQMRNLPPIPDSVYYTDRGGSIIYTETKFGNRTISTLRTTKKHATSILANNNPIEYDNFGEIQLSDPIISPRELSPISFLVKIHNVKTNSDSIANRFATSPFQSVKVVDSRSVIPKPVCAVGFALEQPLHDATLACSASGISKQPEYIVTVWSSIGSDPTRYGNNEYEIANNVTNNTEQLDEYLGSCGLIDLDDPDLQQLALLVGAADMTVWQTAVALEALVSKSIRSGSISAGFASSSEVLRKRRGNCTERAVLLTALCRKKGIPARIVLGLAYSEQQNENNDNNKNKDKNKTETTSGKMVFHLWNEVYVDRIWRPIDATYGLGGADAARIKITDNSLKNNSFPQICRSIFENIGQIEISQILTTENTEGTERNF